VANQRLDLAVYAQPGNIVFITIRAYQHQSPFVSPTLSQMAIAVLVEEAEHRQCWVYTYCLMPDHLHFLVSPREEGISTLKFTNQYKGKTTNRSGSQAGVANSGSRATTIMSSAQRKAFSASRPTSGIILFANS